MKFELYILHLVKDINKQLNEQLTRIYRPYGLTAAQAMVLMYLYKNGKQNITDLSALLSTGKSNLSPLCKRMEKSGYIRRIRDIEDQRILYIELTHYAEEIMLKASASDPEIELFSEFKNEADQDKILTGLLTLKNNLQNHNHLHTGDELYEKKY